MTVTSKATVAAVFVLFMVGGPGAAIAGNGGGQISNSLPEIVFVSNNDAELTVGDSSVLNCKVRDKNNVADLQLLEVELRNDTGVLVFSDALDISASGSEDQDSGLEPGTWNGNWRVWYPGNKDGNLQCRYQFTYATEGAFTWRVAASDEQGRVFDATKDVVVQVFEGIRSYADPVSDTGSTEVGAPWGGWNAEAAAMNVEGTNWIRVDNTGTNAAQPFTLDFSTANFVGADDATESVDIDGNLEFAAVEVPTSGPFDLQNAPRTWQDANADGARTFTFTNTDNTMFVKYRLKQMPEILKDQDYTVGYTLSL